MINLIVTTNSTDLYDVDFSNLIFSSYGADTIYVSNQYTLSNWTDYQQVYDTSKNNNLGIKFGYNTEIYFFIDSDYGLTFDLYVGNNDEANKVTSYKKLKDIVGNTVKVTMGAVDYEIYVMYQSENIYGGIGAQPFLAYN